MKLLNILAVAVGGSLIAVVIFLVIKAAASKAGQAPGLSAGRLSACSPKPNCVCSEAGTPADKAVEPFALTEGRIDEEWRRFQEVVTAQGGQIVEIAPHYLAATFTSTLFGFVDDLEARLDAESGAIQVRSASRVGTSDLGANRTRIERLRQAFTGGEP